MVEEVKEEGAIPKIVTTGTKDVGEPETNEVIDLTLFISFDNAGTPKYGFNGAWNIQRLGRVRRTLLRAYKHYMRDLRIKMEGEKKNERASE